MLFLLLNRERPTFLSKRWLVVWVKRLINSRRLVEITMKRVMLTMRGVRLGPLTINYGIKLNGSSRNLHVGAHTYMGKNIQIATHDKVVIGSYVCINNDVKILTASHDLSDSKWRMFSRPIVIKDRAWVATGATILPGVTVGEGAVIGAGAVVSRDVPDYALAIGNPAVIKHERRVRELDYDPVIFCAAYEAWIGRNVSLKFTDERTL